MGQLVGVVPNNYIKWPYSLITLIVYMNFKLLLYYGLHKLLKTSIPEKVHKFSCIIIIIYELPLNLSLKFITQVILGF
jgi:hypothetical protein